MTRPPSLPGARGAQHAHLKPTANAAHRRRWKPGTRCIICGEMIFSYQQFNYDHLIPMSKGGSRGKSNKYLSHYICNAVKGNRWPFWLRTVEERLTVRHQVTKETYQKLVRAWEGLADTP